MTILSHLLRFLPFRRKPVPRYVPAEATLHGDESNPQIRVRSFARSERGAEFGASEWVEFEPVGSRHIQMKITSARAGGDNLSDAINVDSERKPEPAPVRPEHVIAPEHRFYRTWADQNIHMKVGNASSSGRWFS